MTVAYCATRVGFDSLGSDLRTDIEPVWWYSRHRRHRAFNVVRSHPNQNPMAIKTTELVALAATAAEAYDECDTALTELNQSFGVVYEATKDNLLRDVTIASTQGLDLSVFSGEESRFKFPTYNTNIVVRITRKPTPHVKLDKLLSEVEQLEKRLKLAKTRLKNTAEELVIAGECDETIEKIVLAFTRLRK